MLDIFIFTAYLFIFFKIKNKLNNDEIKRSMLLLANLAKFFSSKNQYLSKLRKRVIVGLLFFMFFNSCDHSRMKY